MLISVDLVSVALSPLSMSEEVANVPRAPISGGAASVSRASTPPTDGKRIARALILMPIVVGKVLRSPLLKLVDAASSSRADVDVRDCGEYFWRVNSYDRCRACTTRAVIDARSI